MLIKIIAYIIIYPFVYIAVDKIWDYFENKYYERKN